MNKIIISFFTLLILTACAAPQEEPVDYQAVIEEEVAKRLDEEVAKKMEEQLAGKLYINGIDADNAPDYRGGGKINDPEKIDDVNIFGIFRGLDEFDLGLMFFDDGTYVDINVNSSSIANYIVGTYTAIDGILTMVEDDRVNQFHYWIEEVENTDDDAKRYLYHYLYLTYIDEDGDNNQLTKQYVRLPASIYDWSNQVESSN